jgi:glycosyltransferase involved in cell wall biosynthesis
LEGPIDIPFKGMEDAFLAVQDLDCEIWCISSAGKPRSGWRCDRFFEKVPMIDMKRIYSSCDIFLKMSRIEGFFGPPLEMMACGGACVVGEVTGYDEYIVHGYNALVVREGDVEGAKNAVRELIQDIALREKLIENGKKTASLWRWEPSIDELERIYRVGIR